MGIMLAMQSAITWPDVGMTAVCLLGIALITYVANR